MEKQACSSPVHAQSRKQEKESELRPGSSSPGSAFARLCRKLSPRRTEKRTLSITPAAPMCGKFERVFRYFDEDGDGKVSPAELRSCMKAVGEELTLEESEAVVESLDSDGDGLLGLEDFEKLVEVRGEEEESRDLREAFGMYQMEGLGCITPKSLRRMLSRLGEKKTIDECKAMICRFDLNGDGVLSFEEFRIMMV